MRISDWSSDVCSSDLLIGDTGQYAPSKENGDRAVKMWLSIDPDKRDNCEFGTAAGLALGVEVSIVTDSVPPRSFQRTWTVRSEEHTSELQSLMRISYAVFCLKKKK